MIHVVFHKHLLATLWRMASYGNQVRELGGYFNNAGKNYKAVEVKSMNFQLCLSMTECSAKENFFLGQCWMHINTHFCIEFLLSKIHLNNQLTINSICFFLIQC